MENLLDVFRPIIGLNWALGLIRLIQSVSLCEALKLTGDGFSPHPWSQVALKGRIQRVISTGWHNPKGVALKEDLVTILASLLELSSHTPGGGGIYSAVSVR